MSRDVVRWTLRQLGVDEWLVQTVMVMYEKARTTKGQSKVVVKSLR